jgi:hypothetical protein
MTSLREMRDKGYIPQRTQVKLILGGVISLGKLSIKNHGDIKILRQM